MAIGSSGAHRRLGRGEVDAGRSPAASSAASVSGPSPPKRTMRSRLGAPPRTDSIRAGKSTSSPALDRQHQARIGVGEDLADLLPPIAGADAGGDGADARRAEIAEQVLGNRRQQQHQPVAACAARRQQPAREAIARRRPTRRTCGRGRGSGTAATSGWRCAVRRSSAARVGANIGATGEPVRRCAGEPVRESELGRYRRHRLTGSRLSPPPLRQRDLLRHVVEHDLDRDAGGELVVGDVDDLPDQAQRRDRRRAGRGRPRRARRRRRPAAPAGGRRSSCRSCRCRDIGTHSSRIELQAGHIGRGGKRISPQSAQRCMRSSCFFAHSQ